MWKKKEPEVKQSTEQEASVPFVPIESTPTGHQTTVFQLNEAKCWKVPPNFMYFFNPFNLFFFGCNFLPSQAQHAKSSDMPQ